MDEYKDIRFDIAISFAGEDRKIASKIAKKLHEKGFRVFFDEFYKSEIWGKDLTSYLADIFGKLSRYCLILASEHYVNKIWTAFELEQALLRQLTQNEEYILLLRLDETGLKEYPSTRAYIIHTSEKATVDIICEKLQKEKFSIDRADARKKLNDLAREYLHQEGIALDPKRALSSAGDQADYNPDATNLDKSEKEYYNEISEYLKKYKEYYDPLSLIRNE